MADEDWKIQVSLKDAAGAMLNVRAGSSGDAGDHLSDLRTLAQSEPLLQGFFPQAPQAADPAMAAAVTNVQQGFPQAQQVAAPIVGAPPVQQAPQQFPQQAPAPQAQPVQQAPTGAPCEKCRTPKVWKTRRDGGGWWSCPNERKGPDGRWSCT